MFSGRRLVELQWCMTLDDCTSMPLIVINSVMVKELVGLGEELKIERIMPLKYTRVMCVHRLTVHMAHILVAWRLNH